MAPRYPVRQEDFFYDLYWTEAMDKLFIKVLLDQQLIGNFIPGEVNENAIHICMHVVNKTFDKAFTYRYCIGRLAMLEKRYRVFYWIKRKHGVRYDEVTNTLTAPENVCDDIFQKNEFSIAYQEFNEPRWNDLKVLFDGLLYDNTNVQLEVIEISSDSETKDIDNLEGLPKPPTQGNIINISFSQSSRARSFWKYLEQFDCENYESQSESSVNQLPPSRSSIQGPPPTDEKNKRTLPRQPRRPYFPSPCKSTKSVDTSGSCAPP